MIGGERFVAVPHLFPRTMCRSPTFAAIVTFVVVLVAPTTGLVQSSSALVTSRTQARHCCTKGGDSLRNIVWALSLRLCMKNWSSASGWGLERPHEG